MANIPTGGGGYTIAQIEQIIAGEFGAAAGAGYVAYAEAHPNQTPQESGNQYADILLAQGVSKGLSTAVTVGGGVVTGVPAAAAKGAQNVVADLSPGAIFASLTSRALWVRVAEGVLGILLVAVAVAELGKGTAVGNLAKKVPFV